jgi:ABC-type uncharacterized transport system permease subunit
LYVATLSWHEIAAYAIASAVYLAFLLGLRRSAENVGRAMLGLGVLLHFIDIGVRCVKGMHPISSTPEAMSLVAFLIASGYLITSLRYHLPVAGAFAVPAALALLVVARLAPAETTMPRLGPLGSAHILLATFGVAVFALAAALALVYLFQDRQLKRKQFGKVMGTGAPLETLDRLALRCVSIGFPVFTVAIVTGAIWIARLGLLQTPGGLRPEYLFAFGSWLVFGILLVARVGAGWRGRRAAWLTLGGFGSAMLVVAAYFLRHAA